MRTLLAVVIGLALLLVGCSADRYEVKALLEAEGITVTEVGGWTWYGCGRDDEFVNTFRGVKNGVPVSGWVCSGWFKGYTIRYR